MGNGQQSEDHAQREEEKETMNLRERIKLAGLNPASFARHLGVSRQAIQNYLTGQRVLPRDVRVASKGCLQIIAPGLLTDTGRHESTQSVRRPRRGPPLLRPHPLASPARLAAVVEKLAGKGNLSCRATRA